MAGLAGTTTPHGPGAPSGASPRQVWTALAIVYIAWGSTYVALGASILGEGVTALMALGGAVIIVAVAVVIRSESRTPRPGPLPPVSGIALDGELC